MNKRFVLKSEMKSRKFARRSIYAKQDIKIGEKLSNDNLIQKDRVQVYLQSFLNL